MLKKAYVEITNRCNLSCAFCPKTKREARTMTAEEFTRILDRLCGRVSYVYLHVMGEPLLHPQLGQLMALCDERGMKVCITTNGTLLSARGGELLRAKNLHKVSVSLHSFEGSGRAPGEEPAYLQSVWDFAAKASARGVIVALRLWNEGGAQTLNEGILDFLREKLGCADWPETREGSFRLADRLYLERAQKFDWPDLNADETNAQFCYALRDQLGVLADGTVVPCCLDHEGDLALGNLLEQDLDTTLSSTRAQALREGFSHRTPAEELCRRCGYATRFNH